MYIIATFLPHVASRQWISAAHPRLQARSSGKPRVQPPSKTSPRWPVPSVHHDLLSPPADSSRWACRGLPSCRRGGAQRRGRHLYATGSLSCSFPLFGPAPGRRGGSKAIYRILIQSRLRSVARSACTFSF